MTDALQERWKQLYAHDLPSLARSKAPSQPHWPVHLDHCFARIILDAVIGRQPSASPTDAPTPWTAKLQPPAIKNMTSEQLHACIALGEAIASGATDLVDLDKQSLSSRNEKRASNPAPKRKREDSTTTSTSTSTSTTTTVPQKKKPPPATQTDIRASFGLPTSHPSPSPANHPPPRAAATVPPALASEINSHPTLTPYRRRVLLALCQVPPGHHTTYLALSNHLHSSPRAVGNALRHNPLAPRVPCHRVVAAGGGIGGFGGGWGVEGKYHGEKVRLLKGEGVEVEVGGARVRGVGWEGFV